MSPAPVAAEQRDDGTAVGVEQLLAVAEPARRAHEGLPRRRRRIDLLEQEDLDGAAGGPAQAQPRRQDPGVVDDDDVAGSEQVGEVGDGAVLGGPAPAVDEQPGGVARLDRDLGDALGRQVVVELVEPHRSQGTNDVPRSAPVTTQRDEQVTIGDEGAMAMTVWLPDGGSGPALLLLQEIFGVGSYIAAVAERLAGAGYVVGAPDVFWRFAPGWHADHDEAGLTASLQQVGNLDPGKAVEDCIAALEHLDGLAETTGRPGVLGFCLGGTLAFGVAVGDSPSVCVSYYGSASPACATAWTTSPARRSSTSAPTTPTSRRTASRRSPPTSPGGPTSCSTWRAPATPSTTTRRRCSTTRGRRARRGRRRWPSSPSTCPPAEPAGQSNRPGGADRAGGARSPRCS